MVNNKNFLAQEELNLAIILYEKLNAPEIIEAYIDLICYSPEPKTSFWNTIN